MSEIGTMLADTAERLFAAHAPALEQADDAWPEAAWAAIEESGLPLALVPEEDGGFGLPPAEAFDLIRQTGRHALALPLAETIIANAALAAAGLPLAEGPAALITANHGGERVAWGRFAKTFVVEQDGTLQRLDHGSFSATSKNLASMPRDSVTLDHAGQGAATNGPSLLELGALARALQPGLQY